MSSSSQTNDLKNRILFTIFILAIYRFGTFVPLPGIDPEQLQVMMSGNQKGLLGMFNVFAGGAVSRMAIFALGIMPYISSSIIVQLLTGVSDYFKNLKAQGEVGRAKITIIKTVETAPVLPNSKVVTRALGISATIPAKIINEIPLPIPLWVICSPSHIKNIVPATIVETAVITKNIPGLITKSGEDCRPIVKPYPWIVANKTVPYLVICVILALPTSP